MSTTGTDDDTEMSCGGDKRGKVAIIFAFCGVGYQGMQRNPGAKTIEGELEEALFHAGAVPESDRGKPKQYDFSRSARTDKGVSAVGQVVSGRFYVDPPGFVGRLNSNLPDQIRVFGYKRVTRSFSSKKFCDRRRYVYLIPVFALDPITHRDREAVMASLGSGEEYVKCFECSERGRKNKIPGVMGNHKGNNFDSKLSNKLNSSRTDVKGEALSSSLGLVDVEVARIQEDGCREESAEKKKINGEGNEMSEAKSEFCYGDKEKERFNRILSYYVGSHNFHNFTTRMKADDPAANRSIISFTANTVINLDGIDFIKCEVLGRSFMLHQIRKMMGLAVAIMRNCAPETLIQTAFSKDVNITVPMAPEVGLYLDECFFTSYNNTKFEDSHEKVSMEAYKEEAEAFKLKHIYPHIGSAERKYGSVALWLHSLNYRNYPDLNYGRNGHNKEHVLVYKIVGETQEITEPEPVLVSKQNDEN